MKCLLSNIVLFSVLITGCTNVTVQAPQAVPTVTASKAPSEPSSPVAVAASQPSTVVPGQSSSSCNYFTGSAVEGQAVNVDLCSVSPRSSGTVAFTYSLGSKKMKSEANCDSGTWTTLSDRDVHRPQSLATEKMLSKVCGDRGSSHSSTSQAGAAIVFDPPSNIRSAPNGGILCSVKGKTTINIYGSNGSWYNTDVCGTMGVISADQIRF
jgi:hypothetical protein